MNEWLKGIINKIKSLNYGVESYTQDTVIQSLPTVAYVNRAKKLIDIDKFDEAKTILLEALELPYKDPRVHKYLGLVYDKAQDFANAVEAYQNSADLNPNDKVIWQKLGFALLHSGKHEQAEKAFENANKIWPRNTDTFTGWGMSLMNQKKHREAEEKFSTAAEINKNNYTAIFLSAVMNMRLLEYDKAESKLAFLSNAAPNESNSYEYARLKFIKGDLNNAEFYAEKSLGFNASMLPAYILLGKISAQNCEKEKSLGYFRTAFAKELVSDNLYLEWGFTLMRFGNCEGAKEKFLTLLATNPDNDEAKVHLALCNVLTGLPASEDLQEKSGPTWDLVKGIYAYESGQTEDALKLLKGSVDDEMDNSIDYYYLAKCYERNNNDEKVKENYEASLEENPMWMNVYLDYANYLIGKKDPADAQRKLRRALKYDENSPAILNLLFYTGYMLVKKNPSDYNIKETLGIADKIPEELFEYTEQKLELTSRLKS